MKDFLEILSRLGIDNRLMTHIAPNAMTGHHATDDKFYEVLSNELRVFIYKQHYDSSMILQLADDVPTAEKKNRLEQIILPCLQANSLLALGHPNADRDL